MAASSSVVAFSCCVNFFSWLILVHGVKWMTSKCSNGCLTFTEALNWLGQKVNTVNLSWPWLTSSGTCHAWFLAVKGLYVLKFNLAKLVFWLCFCMFSIFQPNCALIAVNCPINKNLVIRIMSANYILSHQKECLLVCSRLQVHPGRLWHTLHT